MHWGVELCLPTLFVGPTVSNLLPTPRQPATPLPRSASAHHRSTPGRRHIAPRRAAPYNAHSRRLAPPHVGHRITCHATATSLWRLPSR